MVRLLNPSAIARSLRGLNTYMTRSYLISGSNSFMTGTRAFSSSQGSSTGGLLKAVESEIDHEKLNENQNTEIPLAKFRASQLPEQLSSYLTKTGFKIEESLGRGLVTLVRETGNEVMQVKFDVEQVYSQENEKAEFDDAEDKEDFEESQESFFTLEVSITRKDNGKRVVIDCDLFPTDLFVNGIRFPSSVEEKDDGCFRGPDLQNLDDELTQKFTEYLEEHHINDGLFSFLWEYSTAKEYSEYCHWLQQWKEFLN